MAEYGQLPDTVNLPLDEEKIKSGKPEELYDYLKKLVLALKGNFEDFSNAFNIKPEYQEGNTQPAAANGQFLVWKDTAGGKMRLLYGDQDQTFELTVQFASADETKGLTLDNKAVTPAGLGACLASETQKGIIQLATAAEVQGQTVTDKAVTPATLGLCTATEDQKGIVERATNAEAQAGTDTERYITPYQLKNYSGKPPYVKVSDVKPSGTHGGTFTSGAWQTRTLNTKDTDTHNIATLSNNQITLPPGTYECYIVAPAYAVQGHRARLYNVTGGSVLLSGTNALAYQTYPHVIPSIIIGRFTLAQQSSLRVEHRCYQTCSNYGFGVACSFGDNEVYTVAEFWKVG